MEPDLILHGGRITTLNHGLPEAQALAVVNDRLVAVGSNDEVLQLKGPTTQSIDLNGRRVVPGLNDLE
jgi:predicted amidohydrolase YtcJ